MARVVERRGNGTPRARHRARAGLAVLAIAGAVGLAGCGHVLNAIANHVTHGKLDQGEAAVSSLDSKIQSASSTFQVTYVTTGSQPATVTVAASPPKDFAFVDTASSGAVAADLIQNSSGSYFCNRQTGSASRFACTKLTKNTLSTYNAMKVLYTGRYWEDFLEVYKYAGVVGVSITSSTMTVNGFNLQCVVAKGSAGTTTTAGTGTTGPTPSSTVCVTSAGILAYVKTSSDSTAFEIKAYSSSPSASLFQVPAGATVTTLPAVTSTTS